MPIVDLLRGVPIDARAIDARATHEEGEGVGLRFHMIPYGQHCHEAADEIERLREQLRLANLATLKEVVEIQTIQPLRDRIEELEHGIGGLQDLLCFISDAMWGGELGWDIDRELFKNEVKRRLSGYLFTTEQINAAWEAIRHNPSAIVRSAGSVLFSIFHILPCDKCGGGVSKAWDNGCPDCHGHGWRINNE